MVKIQDVAREAGVSVSTVSRVLNNSFTVTGEKRTRVLNAVERLGYQPLRARTPKADKGKVILVVTSIIIKELFNSLRQTAHQLGYSVLFNYIGEETDDYEASFEVLQAETGVCGIITLNNMLTPQQHAAWLGRYAVVQVGQAVQAAPSFTVNIDDVQAGYDMARYLLERGYQTLGFVGAELAYSADRLSGFKRALGEEGIALPPEWHIPADYSMEGGREAAQRLLALPSRPRAVCCASDFAAAGCIHGLTQSGLQIPRDIAVAGFDNTPDVAEACSPGITTVNLPKEELGAEAVHMLHQILQTHPATGRRLLIPHSIVPRGSA